MKFYCHATFIIWHLFEYRYILELLLRTFSYQIYQQGKVPAHHFFSIAKIFVGVKMLEKRDSELLSIKFNLKHLGVYFIDSLLPLIILSGVHNLQIYLNLSKGLYIIILYTGKQKFLTYILQ